MEVHQTILHQDQIEDLNAVYPFLAEMDHQSHFKLMNNSLQISLPPQTFLQTSNGPYDHLFLLLEGNTRAYQCDENGRELTFYRNYPGDICNLNVRQLLNSETPDGALVRAETAIHGIQVSKKVYLQTMQSSEVFRDAILQSLTQRFDQLTDLLQRSVFHKLDRRLCHLLQDMFKQSNQATLKITHQKLANELGTTREVISRSLKQLEKGGCLTITRGQLTMVDSNKLS